MTSSQFTASEDGGTLKQAGGDVVLLGQFDPATIATLMPPEMAHQLAAMKRAPGVPLHSLAATLVKRRIQTTLVGALRGTEELHLRSNPLSVAVVPKRGSWPFVLNGYRQEREAILKLLADIQPSVVHAHWTFEAGRAAADWQGPKLLTIHDAAWDYARVAFSINPRALAFTARWLANTAATLCGFNHIVAVSPFVETYLRTRHRFKGEIRIIPNAVPELPSDIVVPTNFPKSGQVTFAAYGPMSGVKNVGAAVKAFRQLRKKLPDSRLLIYGGGTQPPGTPAEDEGIEMRGAVAHREFLRVLAQEVDVWVHPSRIEAHPLSICEAIQAGCLVIAGKNSGGVAWTLDSGSAGILVDIESPDAIGAAMYSAVVDRAASVQMIEHGRAFIRSAFNADRVMDMHLEYYRDIQ